MTAKLESSTLRLALMTMPTERLEGSPMLLTAALPWRSNRLSETVTSLAGPEVNTTPVPACPMLPRLFAVNRFRAIVERAGPAALTFMPFWLSVNTLSTNVKPEPRLNASMPSPVLPENVNPSTVTPSTAPTTTPAPVEVITDSCAVVVRPVRASRPYCAPSSRTFLVMVTGPV